MNISGIELSGDCRLNSIGWARLPGVRPRESGCNARLGKHGKFASPPIAVIRMGGVSGFGSSHIHREAAERLVGMSAAELFEESGAVREPYRALEYPLLDWLGNVAGNYASGHLAGAIRGFRFIEWDEGNIAGVDRAAYVVRGGEVTIPNRPGFGLGLDLERFEHERAASGWAVL